MFYFVRSVRMCLPMDPYCLGRSQCVGTESPGFRRVVVSRKLKRRGRELMHLCSCFVAFNNSEQRSYIMRSNFVNGPRFENKPTRQMADVQTSDVLTNTNRRTNAGDICKRCEILIAENISGWANWLLVRQKN